MVNVADESYAAGMARTGESIPYGESEFHHAGLTPAPSRVVKPPRVGEASVSFECRTTHVIPIGAASLVIGEVQHIHVRDDLVDDRYRVDADKLAADRPDGRQRLRPDPRPIRDPDGRAVRLSRRRGSDEASGDVPRVGLVGERSAGFRPESACPLLPALPMQAG